MKQYSDVCDKTSNIKSKRKHFQNITHNEFEKSIRIKHIIQNSDFFVMGSIIDKHITHHKKTRIISF